MCWAISQLGIAQQISHLQNRRKRIGLRFNLIAAINNMELYHFC
jgi:hypothetical protein